MEKDTEEWLEWLLLEVLDLFPLIPFERIWITKQFISATFRGYLACTIFFRFLFLSAECVHTKGLLQKTNLCWEWSPIHSLMSLHQAEFWSCEPESGGKSDLSVTAEISCGKNRLARIYFLF